ncbi:MAG: preprotein translocase subunit SecG [Candidatus Taylorbacteria bacterium]|nr:preprotein translocase subunit SecG [Candidatus Taylorbacteria bacterium]
MNNISSVLPYIQIILAVALIGLILMQRTSASLGGAFGGGSDNFSSAFHTRRGLEKTIFNITIVVAIIFVITTVVSFFLK